MLLADGCVELAESNNLNGKTPSKKVQAKDLSLCGTVPIMLCAILFKQAANKEPAKYTKPLRFWLKILAINKKNAIKDGAMNEIN